MSLVAGGYEIWRIDHHSCIHALVMIHHNKYEALQGSRLIDFRDPAICILKKDKNI